MAAWNVARYQVAVAGRVVDAETKLPLGGALVELTTVPAAVKKWMELRAREAASLGQGAPGVQRAARDGSFRFANLPAGSYTVTASLPAAGSRYGTAKATGKVVAQGDGVTAALLELALPPTAVRGTVTAAGEPVAMAEVALKGGESTYTDAAGAFLLSGVEAGARTLLVRARGLAPATVPAKLAAGAKAAVVDVALKPA